MVNRSSEIIYLTLKTSILKDFAVSAQRDILFGWIEACIRYGGMFGAAEKSAYCHRFGLSEPSASRHQAEFAVQIEAEHGQLFERDDTNRLRAGRLSLAPDAVLPAKPMFARAPALEEWLRDMFGKSAYFEVEIPRRAPEPWILRTIVQSIRTKTPITISYHSRNVDSRRSLSPHAIVKIAGRMHIRAFDHAKNTFADFVLSRITAATLDPGLSYIGRDQDRAWHTHDSLLIQAIGDNLKRGVQLDYQLDAQGIRQISVREPFVQYLIDDMDTGYAPPVKISRTKRLHVSSAISAFQD